MVCTQSFSFASKYAFDAAELDFIFLATVTRQSTHLQSFKILRNPLKVRNSLKLENSLKLKESFKIEKIL